MATKRTFGTEAFGSLVTSVAPHLIENWELQEAEDVSRDVSGALSPCADDSVVYTTTVDINGMKAVRYGGATHVIFASQWKLYVDNVEIGDSCGPSTHRFVCDGERVYIFSADGNNKVWDGTTLREFGPFGSDWDDVTNDAQTMLVSNDDGTAAGLTGVYKWAASYRITLESGQVIESKLWPLWIDAGGDPDENFAGSITLTASDGVMMYMRQVTQAELDAWCPDLGTGKVEGVFWRTKNGGVDYWQDSVVAQADIVGTVGRYGQYDTVLDDNLGALYLDTDDAHGPPPSTANLAVFCQRRLFLAVKGDRTLSFSGIDQYDYYAPLDSVECEDTIEGLSVIGESVAVVTPSGIRLWSPVDEIGQWSNSSSSVGTTYQDSLVTTDFGLLFARIDGLYLFDGVSSRRVSEQVDDYWQMFNSPSSAWRGAYVNGFGFFSNGLIAVEFKYSGGKFTWSTSSRIQSNTAVGVVCADPSDAGLWASTLGGVISRLHMGTGVSSMTAKTKDFGDGLLRHWDRLVLDFSGSLAGIVTTNRGATQAVASSVSGRQQLRLMLPATMIGELCNVQLTGTGTVYGVRLETT